MEKNPTYDELYAQVRGLERRSDLFRTIQQINRLITKEKDRNRLLSNACELLVGTRGYHNAFIVLVENGRLVSHWFHDGFDGNFEPMAAILEAGHLPDCAGRTLEHEGPRVVADPADQCRNCPFADTYKGRAGMSMRLEHNRRLFGWLSVSIPRDLIAHQDEKDLFCEVCADISFALWSLETEAQRDAFAKKYAVVLRATSNAVISVDTEGMITLFNLGAEKLLDCCTDEALGTPVFRFFPEHKQAEQKETLTRVIAQAATLTFEAQCTSRQGRQIPVELTVDTIVDENGHAVGATCIFHDITERKTAEQILSKSEEKYRALYDNAPLSYQSLDDDGRFLDVNPTWLKTLGYERGEVIGKAYAEFLHPDWKPHFEINFPEFKRRGHIHDVQFKLRHKMGHYIDVSFEGCVGYHPDGSFQQTYCVFKDITEQRQAEHALRDSERFLRSILQTMGDGFWLVDRQGRLMDVNGAYCAMSGYARDELVGMHIGDLEVIETQAQIASRIERVIAAGSDIFESLHRRKDGTVFPVEISANWLADPGGRFVCFTRDQSTRKQQEAHIALLGRMLDAAPASIMIHDAQGRIYYANKASLDLHGYESEAELLALRMHDIDVPESKALFADRLRRIIEHGEARFEVAHFRKDGTTFPLEVMAKAIEWKGRPAVLSIAVDITERKLAEATIAHSHDLMHYIIEHANSAVAVHDRDLKYIYVSRSYLNQFNVKEKNIIGRHHYEIFPDLPQKWRTVHQKALNGEISRSERDDFPQPDGTVEWTRWECRPWYQADGAIGGFVVYTEIITDRVRAEEALRKSEEKFRLLVENSPDAIFVQTKGRFAYLNRSAVSLFGVHSSEELIGTDVMDRFHPDFHEAVRQRIKLLNQAKEKVPAIKQIYLRMDGSPVEVEVSAVPISYEGHDGALVFARDISERILKEKEQKKLEQQLVQAQKMESVGRLAGGVAHDYNNMLSVILGYTEMALEKLDVEDELRPDFQEILSAAKRSRDITRQLLAFSRQQTIAPKVLDLNATLEGMLKMLRRLIGEDVDLVWHPKALIWPVYLDPTQLDQILVNLCVNARDAIADVGTISIETGIKTFDEAYCADHTGFVPGDYVLLSVSDDGCGMDKKTQENLFEPFFTTKPKGQGTGLGLATVFGIVRQNKGFINVYSEPGQGTTFNIYLPRHKDPIVDSLVKETTKADARGNETILLVEDEPTILMMTAKMLERLGYTVLKAGKPADAIQTANEYQGHLHLLLSDIVMPEMNGRELSEKLQAIHPGLKVLFMSGYTANVIADRGVLYKGVNFIQKPFSKNDLALKVRAVLDNGASR